MLPLLPNFLRWKWGNRSFMQILARKAEVVGHRRSLNLENTEYVPNFPQGSCGDAHLYPSRVLLERGKHLYGYKEGLS